MISDYQDYIFNVGHFILVSHKHIDRETDTHTHRHAHTNTHTHTHTHRHTEQTLSKQIDIIVLKQ